VQIIVTRNALYTKADAEAVAYVELAGTLFKEHCMEVGIHVNTVTVYS